MDGRDEFIGEQVTVTEHSDPTICGWEDQKLCSNQFDPVLTNT